MGRQNVKFSCHHCGHCCTEVICLPTPWDVIRIVRDTGQDPYKFLEFVTPDDIEDVDEFDPTWLYVKDKRYMMALRRYADGCHFLDKKTKYCTIYESRPILCRLYPFKVTEYRDGSFKGFTLHTDVGCPRNRDGLVAVKPLYDLYMEDTIHTEDYEALVKVFNAKDYPGKKPQDFIEMFIIKESKGKKHPAKKALR